MDIHHTVNHPLILDKLTKMRDDKTPSIIFRNNLFEITQLIAYEATRDLELVDVPVNTPVASTIGKKLKNELVIVPILRAGLGMSDALVNLMPTASVGHIGLYRNETTLEPIKYYEKVPTTIKNADVIICDPMIATANSVMATIKIIEKYQPKSIRVVGLVAAPEGLAQLKQHFSHIHVYVAAVDEKLNDIGYIVPGLGDAGDRIFKTK